MRNKEYYKDYVCPYCLNVLEDCICKLFPPYHLIHIDRNIQEHIRILNKKGYRTIYCCEGHDAGSNTYIIFARDYFKDIAMPNNFKYIKNKNMINYSYSSKLTIEKIEELKKKNLKILLEWCKKLPDLKELNVEN